MRRIHASAVKALMPADPAWRRLVIFEALMVIAAFVLWTVA